MREDEQHKLAPVVCLAMKHQKLVISMGMEKHLVCIKRENWRA